MSSETADVPETRCHSQGWCIRAFEDETCEDEGQCTVYLAVQAERSRCLRIANGWLIAFGSRGDELKFTSPQQWANDAVEDIADMIASGSDPFPRQPPTGGEK